jgi:hypothetical protein
MKGWVNNKKGKKWDENREREKKRAWKGKILDVKEQIGEKISDVQYVGLVVSKYGHCLQGKENVM